MTSPVPTVLPGAFLVMEDAVTIHARSRQTAGAFLAIEVTSPPAADRRRCTRTTPTSCSGRCPAS